ncbi:hypothetical protein LQZ18_01475 [Lachnospiraceae bacterium ZAX-1]
MEDTKFLEFLDTIENHNRAFVRDINQFLLDSNCKCEMKAAKSGVVASYILKETKRTLATFVCRKTGVKLRIYPQNLSKYEGFLNTFPAKMKQEIRKSSVCKRRINPNDCNPKCVTGYDFVMDEEHHQKCRYMAFMPTLTEENNPFIREFLEKELSN